MYDNGMQVEVESEIYNNHLSPMDTDVENASDSIDSQITPVYERKKINQVELRIQNDLMEIKRNKMSTKMFETQMSDIVKDEVNQIFTMNVLIKKGGPDSDMAYHFFIVFDRDYPFTPPLIKLLNFQNGQSIISQIDEHGNLKLKFLSVSNWSPILSLNSILFAIELLILDPEDSSTNNINSLDLYRREELFLLAKKSSGNFFIQSLSPKIVKNRSIGFRGGRLSSGKKSLKRKYGDFEKEKNNAISEKNVNKFTVGSVDNSDNVYNNMINYQVKRLKQLSLEK